MEEALRKTGIGVIGDVTWGTHFCQFYETKEDVTDILVPYFKAGLENNEFCMWITSEPVSMKEAVNVLREAEPNLDEYLRKGQIEIIPYNEWYLKDGVFKPERVLNGWIEKLNNALDSGYAGLRLTGNTFWLEKYLWKEFADYELEVNSVIGNYKMMAICMYSIEKCGANEILDVMSTHQFALIKRKGAWRVIESSDLKHAKQALKIEAEERRETEYALLMAEERLRLHMENSPLAVVEWNRDFIVTLWAGEAENIFGWSAEEAVGKPIMNLHMIYDEDIPIVQKTMERLSVATSKHVISSNRNYTKDGRVIHCMWYNSIVQDAQGQMSSVLSFVLDNTDAVKTQEALREREKRYRSYIEVTDQIAWTTDADGSVIEDLPTWRKYTGQSFDEIMGWGWSKALHPDDLERTIKIWKRSVSDRSGYETEYRLRRFDGVYRHFLARGIPVLREDGTIREWVGTNIDITERKKMEDELRSAYDELEARVGKRTMELKKANEALQAEISERKKIEAQMLRAQRMESIGTLAAGIAHDFNNILTPIMLNSTAALMDLPKDSPVRKYLEHTLTSANRAKGLVQHMLTYSRKGEYDLKPLNFQDILMEAIKLVRASLPSTIEISQKIDSRGPVLADPTQMHQIVMNLCTNAYQAMRESGGILTIALDEVDVDAEFARRNMNLRPGRYVRFTVTDTGHGMDEAIMERIFDPFFTTKGAGGTGLGLSVVQGIVLSHGGDIDVQSQTGKGTTFHIFLPRAADGVKQAEVKKDESVPAGNERILFVDDETEITSMGKAMLERLGYNVTAETDSMAALEEFSANPGKYDLVVTDYTMPKMNGLELAKKLKGIRPEILIIIASGFNEAIRAEKLQPSGINSVILKPYTISDLAKSVRQAIDKGSDLRGQGREEIKRQE